MRNFPIACRRIDGGSTCVSRFSHSHDSHLVCLPGGSVLLYVFPADDEGPHAP
jgi:hypothetical protein